MIAVVQRVTEARVDVEHVTVGQIRGGLLVFVGVAKGDTDEDVALLIPEGVAHGFQALADGSALLYQHGAPYTPACEDGVRHDDPALRSGMLSCHQHQRPRLSEDSRRVVDVRDVPEGDRR